MRVEINVETGRIEVEGERPELEDLLFALGNVVRRCSDVRIVTPAGRGGPTEMLRAGPAPRDPDTERRGRK